MNLIEWAVHVTTRFGGPGVGFLLLLENVFPPIPSEVVLPLAGVAAGSGAHPYWVMLVWSVLGGLLGAYLLYGLGRAIGGDRVRRLCERLPLLDADDYDRAEAWFDRHGAAGVVVGRMVPGVRSLISIPAGVARMGIARFTLYTVAGSTLWNALFITAGFLLGERWELIAPWTDLASWVVVVVIVALVGWFVVTRLRRNARRRHQ